MQTWEYMYAMVSEGKWSDESGRVAKIDYKKGTGLGSLLNELGVDGWELVNAEGGHYTGQFFFKRPLPKGD